MKNPMKYIILLAALCFSIPAAAFEALSDIEPGGTLTEQELRIKRFSLAAAGSSVAEKIAEDMGEKSLGLDNVTFRRVGSDKQFNEKQVQDVNLNTLFSVLMMDVDADNGRFTAQLKPQYGEYTIEMKGGFSVNQKVPVLARNVSKGQLITQEDIELKSFPRSAITGSHISDIKKLVGKSAAKSLAKDRMLTEDDIRNPVTIAKNSAVSAIYRAGGIEVKALAVALEDGSEGEVIRLKNFDSGKVFRAVVMADGTVITSPDNSPAATDISAGFTTNYTN